MLSPSSGSGKRTYHPLCTNYVTALSGNSHKCRNPSQLSQSCSAVTTLVVVPSMDQDTLELTRMCPTAIFTLEERQLYNLLLLHDNPNLRIIYLSSQSVSEHVVGYYLRLGNGNESNLHDQLSRVHMLSTHDPTLSRALSQKILDRPQLISLIRDLVFSTPLNNNSRSNVTTSSCMSTSTSQHYVGLSVFTGSEASSRLSLALGLPLLEADLAHLHWGTKQGSREMFLASGVPYPPGTPDRDCGDYATLLTTFYDEVGAAQDNSNIDVNDHLYLWTERTRYIRSPRALSIGLARQILLKNIRPRRWMVKLNQGFGGKCNATLDLNDLQDDPSYQLHVDGGDCSLNAAPLTHNDAAINALARDIERKLPFMKFEDPTLTWDGSFEVNGYPGFLHQIRRLGVIAEALYDNGSDLETTGEEITIRFPSFQGIIVEDQNAGNEEKQNCRVTTRSLYILSTHEQILNGHIYTGCEMPALDCYRHMLIEYGSKIGRQLAERGVVGHFSVDFLAIPKTIGSSGSYEWDLIAVEINLRQGGTTHPHATMKILVGGGDIDETDGMFKTQDGNPRYYVATDAFKDPLLKGLSDFDLIHAIESRDDPDARALHWNRETKTGTVFHLFRCLKSNGNIGFTSIGSSKDEARWLFATTIYFVKQLAAKKTSSEQEGNSLAPLNDKI